MMPKVRNTPKMKRPRPHLVNRAPSVMTPFRIRGYDSFVRWGGAWHVLPPAGASLDLLDVAGLPALVDRGFGRSVEPQDGEVALARDGAHPVVFLAAGGRGTEIEVVEPSGFCSGLSRRPSDGNGWPLT